PAPPPPPPPPPPRHSPYKGEMGWIYLLAAVAFPPAFVLWRPRDPVPPGRLRVRVAAAVVVVWLVAILWAVQPVARSAGGGSGGGAADVPAANPTDGVPDDGSSTPPPDLTADAGSDAPLIALFGWVPGLAYAGLLLLARKAIERPAVEVLDAPPRVRRRDPAAGRWPW
ncbi:MAG: hypothetical protein JWO31_1400, partial [Phycisphaerales bacterium]|nr:hypothetical protein [Phycisphaerales bacterium]